MQDEIIPEDFRNKVTEEERQKEMADLYLPPRKRKKVNEAGQQVCVAGELFLVQQIFFCFASNYFTTIRTDNYSLYV